MKISLSVCEGVFPGPVWVRLAESKGSCKFGFLTKVGESITSEPKQKQIASVKVGCPLVLTPSVTFIVPDSISLLATICLGSFKAMGGSVRHKWPLCLIYIQAVKNPLNCRKPTKLASKCWRRRTCLCLCLCDSVCRMPVPVASLQIWECAGGWLYETYLKWCMECFGTIAGRYL